MQNCVPILGVGAQHLSPTMFDAFFQRFNFMYNYTLLKSDRKPLSFGPVGKVVVAHMFPVP